MPSYRRSNSSYRSRGRRSRKQRRRPSRYYRVSRGGIQL